MKQIISISLVSATLLTSVHAELNVGEMITDMKDTMVNMSKDAKDTLVGMKDGAVELTKSTQRVTSTLSADRKDSIVKMSDDLRQVEVATSKNSKETIVSVASDTKKVITNTNADMKASMTVGTTDAKEVLSGLSTDGADVLKSVSTDTNSNVKTLSSNNANFMQRLSNDTDTSVKHVLDNTSDTVRTIKFDGKMGAGTDVAVSKVVDAVDMVVETKDNGEAAAKLAAEEKVQAQADAVAKAKADKLAADAKATAERMATEAEKKSQADLVAKVQAERLAAKAKAEADAEAAYVTEQKAKAQAEAVAQAKMAAEAKENIIKLLKVENIEFDVGKGSLTVKGTQTVNKLAAILKKYPSIKVEIAGHTDADGKADFNQKLSQQRVDTVKSTLVSQEVLGERLTAKGYGESQPLVANDTKENKQKNRRVEINIISAQ